MVAPLEYVSALMFARQHTFPNHPHVDADTPAVDSEVCNSFLLFILFSLQ
jgi:hypothetical protein